MYWYQLFLRSVLVIALGNTALFAWSSDKVPVSPFSNDFVAFESGQVRPLALSADRQRLYAVNTPDNRLEIFSITDEGLVALAAVPVGLEPVAVAVRSKGAGGNELVGVVNHLSDSVSFIDMAQSTPNVECTVQVGDEPRDIVFAGNNERYAFITTAHRGQNTPYPDGDYDKAGIGRADVWVFEADALATCNNVQALTIITLFSDKPRALATSHNGKWVYAAAFRSGNRTTAVTENLICKGGSMAAPCPIQGGTAPGGLPGPHNNVEGISGPNTGLIVQYDQESGEWRDELQRDWSDAVRFSLPDLDVFVIDANPRSGPPRERETLSGLSGVGTVLFNMIANPVTGKLYVSNTEANNRVRFEGMGNYAGGAKPEGEPASVRGNLHRARITVIDGGQVLPRHLNKHIDYDQVPVPPFVKSRSLATPLGMAISGDGATLYVAAFGSGTIGVFETEKLENDTFDPGQSSRSYIRLPGGGPTGLALDEARQRLYVMTRFNNSVAVVDLAAGEQVSSLPMNNPEPAHIIEGRRFLYDARLTSSNGEASCSSCHVFADADDLSWDLGDPDGLVIENPNPRALPLGPNETPLDIHPNKGPMTTQSLRGMANHGPMHWRGDRSGLIEDQAGDALDEEAAFMAFNGAFGGLVGRDEGPLTESDMRKFADFVLDIKYPPNPIRALDNSRTGLQQMGASIFSSVEQPFCNGCHLLDPARGFFGTAGLTVNDGLPQDLKVPQFRNVYQKVGMFGMAGTHYFGSEEDSLLSNDFTGPQVRGFGFGHDGSVDSLVRFFHSKAFPAFQELSENQRLLHTRAVEAFALTADSNLPPIVGQQLTLPKGREVDESSIARLELFVDRAASPWPSREDRAAKECDLVAKSAIEGQSRGWLWRPQQTYFLGDDGNPWSMDDLLGLPESGSAVTLTCVPSGSGERIGIDRDRDGEPDNQPG